MWEYALHTNLTTVEFIFSILISKTLENMAYIHIIKLLNAHLDKNQ